jgi:tartrate-resistant acid phosphatase type 5
MRLMKFRGFVWRIFPAFLISVVLFAVAYGDGPATQPSTQPSTGPTVSFFAMGDWGDGGAGQRAVAADLANIVSEQTVPVNAMLLAGDNFYVHLSGVDSPVWQNLFEKMYDPVRLNFPFYVSLGNHDYPEPKDTIELEYSAVHPESRWKLPAHWYRVDFPADHPLVSLFVLDSNKDNLPPDQWAAQMAWLEGELSKPHDGVWTIAMAHHPLFSNGSHVDNGVLMDTWGTIFKKYNLDIYLCGHDHDLQHLEVDGWHTSFVLVGGGGKKLGVMRRDNRGPFSRSMLGFGNLVFTPDKVTVSFYDKDGNVVHSFEKARDGTVTILENTPSDKATTQQLRAIERGE